MVERLEGDLQHLIRTMPAKEAHLVGASVFADAAGTRAPVTRIRVTGALSAQRRPSPAGRNARGRSGRPECPPDPSVAGAPHSFER